MRAIIFFILVAVLTNSFLLSMDHNSSIDEEVSSEEIPLLAIDLEDQSGTLGSSNRSCFGSSSKKCGFILFGLGLSAFCTIVGLFSLAESMHTSDLKETVGLIVCLFSLTTLVVGLGKILT